MRLEAREFVFDERIALGVTFACAMVRRSTFELLGGLEEVMMPNAFGDVDFCARAVEAGFRNYYFGTLEGTHAESKSRGPIGGGRRVHDPARAARPDLRGLASPRP